MSAEIPVPRTFWEQLEERVAATPDAPMLTGEDDAQLSFADYREATLRCAAGLLALGVTPGSRVSLQLPTRVDSIVLMGALARLGAVQNPIVPIYREREIAFCLEETGASFLCFPREAGRIDYPKLVADLDHTPKLIPCLPDLPAGDPATLPPPPTDAEAVRWIYYTSGTTSRPKGARHSDFSVSVSVAGMVHHYQLAPSDRLGMAFPFTHVGGLMNLLTLLQVGHHMVVMEAFEVDAAIELFSRHGVSVIGGGPVFYTAFLNAQRKRPQEPVLPDLRVFTGGGAPMPSEIHYEVQRELGGRGCLHGFGMTECGIVCANHNEDRDERLASTDGRPIPGVELRVRALDGEPAKTGQEGEVEIRGPAVCAGYVDPEATAAAFDAEGWFRTGDVGFRDAEGYVTLTGRLKDIIIRKGENISANEIEDILYTHPKVGDAAVIGLPDAERGELVCAVIRTAPGSEAIGFQEMAEHFRQARVMAQKIPERLEIVEEMPRNPTGKILKLELRERFAEKPQSP